MEKYFIVLQLLTFDAGNLTATEYPTRYTYEEKAYCESWGNTFVANLNDLMKRYQVENLKYSYRCVTQDELTKVKNKFEGL